MKALILVLLFASPAFAQVTPTANPTKVDWVMAPGHNYVNPLSGVASLTAYELAFYAEGSTTASFTKRYPKASLPAPDVNGVISLVVPELQMLAVDTIYTATVASVGPLGLEVSIPSNPFGRPAPMPAPGKPTRVVVQ